MQRARPVRSRPFAAAAVSVVLSALVWSIGLGAVAPGASAREPNAVRTVGWVDVAELPPQGRAVLAAIRAGGPFASRRDGVTFRNREGLLPRRPRGYYAEYTVPTPGATTRGARRIIAGRGTTNEFRTSGEYYYTDDHYRGFRRIRIR